jgi:RNA polymerase sigma-70 factor (ECF subfamily)
LPGAEQLIIKGCLAGSRSSQTELYELYSPGMMVVCLRYAKNREEAEEILQEGFYRVFKYIHQYKNAGSFEGWIRRIMINSALQRYKSKAHLHPVVPIYPGDKELHDSTDIYSDINVKELIRLVQSLPTAYRLIFNLYVFEGFKHREIAKMLGIAEGTSKSNLSDARAILQKALTKKKDTHFLKRSSCE